MDGNTILALVFIVAYVIGVCIAWSRISSESGLIGKLLGKFLNSKIWAKIPACLVLGYAYFIVGATVLVIGTIVHVIFRGARS